MTAEELAIEHKYRVNERLGILLGADREPPTAEQQAMADAEADLAILLLQPQPTHQMKITNNSNLPESLVAAVTFSERDREGCDYTITELLEPSRIVALKRTYADKVTEDAADRLWALLGSAGHEVLKRAAKQLGGKTVEERAVIELEVNGKKFKIGGQLDYATTEKALTDFKFTSVWSVKEGCKPEWIQQLNSYRYLCSHYGVEIERMEIVAIFRDWSKREAARSSPDSYPQQQVEVFHIPVWTMEETEKFLKERIAMHEAARTKLPECTSEEIWEKPEKWAVKKPGNKRASRLYDTEAQAKYEAAAKGMEVEHRPGERVRCESYCPVASFCQIFIQYQACQSLR